MPTPHSAVPEVVLAVGAYRHRDLIANQYFHTWKTDKAWAGTCRRLSFTLIDGTSHQAMFKFTK